MPASVARSQVAGEPVEAADVLAVRDRDPACSSVRRATPEIRTGAARCLCSHSAGFGRPIREDEPVEAEVAVVRLVAEVAAVGPARSSRRAAAWTRPWSHHSQMNPPWSPGVDSIASQYSASVPLLLPIACEYSHMIRGWSWLPLRGVGDDPLDRRVHRCGDVADGLVRPPLEADRALVVERPARVVATQPAGGRIVVVAVARLVAQRPEDDRGVVLVADRHPRDARDPRPEVARVLAQRRPERVRFDVRLADHVEPELVA